MESMVMDYDWSWYGKAQHEVDALYEGVGIEFCH
jgi:hypothetical protein